MNIYMFIEAYIHTHTYLKQMKKQKFSANKQKT